MILTVVSIVKLLYCYCFMKCTVREYIYCMQSKRIPITYI